MDASMAAAAARGADEASVRAAARSVPIAPKIVQVQRQPACRMQMCYFCVHCTARCLTRTALHRVASCVEVGQHTLQAVKAAAAAGVRQVIVSDANSVFIEELLAAHDLQARSLNCCLTVLLTT